MGAWTLRALRLAVLGVLVIVGSISATPPPTSTAAGTAVVAAPSISWKTTSRALADGRTYFVRAPVCAPAGSSACASYLGRKRTLVTFVHGATGLEDRETAARWLQGMNGWSPETIFAFAVSKDGTKAWDAGICCTTEPVDDVGYLARIIDDVDRRWPVDRRRVGVTGLSNGGMLALRATCERPEVFRSAVALAAIFDGPCDEGRVRIAQWHGAADTTVPLEGGSVVVNGVPHTLPPVVELAQRLVEKSTYELRVIPGRGHTMTWEDHKRATLWLISHLPR